MYLYSSDIGPVLLRESRLYLAFISRFASSYYLISCSSALGRQIGP